MAGTTIIVSPGVHAGGRRRLAQSGVMLLLLFASTGPRGAEHDVGIRKSPLWRCSTGDEKHVLWRVKPGGQAGPIMVSGGKILVGTALTKGQGGVAEDSWPFVVKSVRLLPAR